MPTAVVVDGAYYLRRFKRTFPNLDKSNPTHLAAGVIAMADWHIAVKLNALPLMLSSRETIEFHPRDGQSESTELYRIFFYDCPPLEKQMHTPVSKRAINWGLTPEAKLRQALHQQLLRTRKVALRLGRLNDRYAQWRAKPKSVESWLKEPQAFAPTDDDFELDVVQKGVDMKLGLDVASMAYKKQINQLIMVASDADFVPPAKLARREGIDVLLDPMHGNVAEDLTEHVDGIRSSFLPIEPVDLSPLHA